MMGDTPSDALDSAEAPSGTAAAESTDGDAGSTDEQQEDRAQEQAQQDSGAQEQADTADTGGEPDPENTVILAKDGKHTIPYEKLVEAREREREWREQAEAARQELEALRAQAQARADAGEAPTQTDQNAAAAQAAIDAGVDPDIFGDFSEEALAAGIQKLVDAKVQTVLQTLDARLEPIQQRQAAESHNAHYSAIYERHPDADSIAESQEFEDWVNTQPSFARAGFRAVLENGSTAEVIELFDTYKQATGLAEAKAEGTQPKAADLKAAAKQALSKAKDPVPASLSDIPGAAAGPGSPEEVLASLDPADMLDRMQGMTPEQIESFLNRSL